MKICVMGSGGLGGYIGGRLAASGHDVAFVARGEHLRAMVGAGLKITGIHGNFHIEQVHASSNPAELGKADIIIFCVKAYDAEEAAKMLLPVLKESSVIYPFLNGIGHMDLLTKFAGKERVAGGAAYIISTLESPGLIREFSGINKLVVGDLDPGTRQSTKFFIKACQKAGMDTVLSNDIERDLWQKLILMCGFSGVTSVTKKPIGPILADTKMKKLLLDCMHEAFEVAIRKNINLVKDVIQRHMNVLASIDAESSSSMQRDYEAGKKIEVAALNGYIVEAAKPFRIPTPANSYIYSKLTSYAPY